MHKKNPSLGQLGDDGIVINLLCSLPFQQDHTDSFASRFAINAFLENKSSIIHKPQKKINRNGQDILSILSAEIKSEYFCQL
jgi:hypothetical protein